MKFALSTAFSFLLALGLAPAAEIVDIQNGPALAAHLRHLIPQEEGRFQGTLHVNRPKAGEMVIPFTSQTRITGDSWEITYETTPAHGLPAEKLTVIHSPDNPNTYLYSSARNASSEPQKLAGAQAYIPFANSDFWLVDLGLDFFHWPNQKLLEPQMRRSRPCKVLESRPATNAPCPYSKVISWIDNESGGILRAEAYDQNLKRLKEFTVGSFEKISGQWHLQSIEIQDLRTHGGRSRTLLQFDLESEPRSDSKP